MYVPYSELSIASGVLLGFCVCVYVLFVVLLRSTEVSTRTDVTWVTASSFDYLTLYLPRTAYTYWPNPTEPNGHMHMKKPVL